MTLTECREFISVALRHCQKEKYYILPDYEMQYKLHIFSKDICSRVRNSTTFHHSFTHLNHIFWYLIAILGDAQIEVDITSDIAALGTRESNYNVFGREANCMIFVLLLYFCNIDTLRYLIWL